MIRRIWALAIKEFYHLRYDWWLPAFIALHTSSRSSPRRYQ